VIATEAEELARVARGFGAQVEMTRHDHSSGTDRVAEAALRCPARLVINLQGDEPLLPPQALEALVEGINRARTPMATLVAPITDPADLTNPARVKVARRADGRALYFSRLPIPCDRDGTGRVNHLRHVGVYAFTSEFLTTFAGLEPSPLESAERLEQLRALEAGYDIHLVEVAYDGFGVDTIDDLERVRAIVGRLARPAHERSL
jgi:3-deoxy-manno-octulosonate cytidylyltransferase (CMP-KDO synthetase)